MEVSLDWIYTLTPADLSGPPSYRIWTVMFWAMPEESVLSLPTSTMPLGAKGEVWACASPVMTIKPASRIKMNLLSDNDVIP
jgi:hypothetical protein